ncbi:GNAT family N-acetyltransferase [Georgenia sp. SUBG003]|uniref:GNAT family N-acetyltransferase n=1 Tax=Georgenia sp. SUBG003 TaxID=1497974 RepID=UPI000694C329
MSDVRIERWGPDDLWLLRRANSAEMTRYLVASETDDELENRHAKYLRHWETGEARMFRIVADGQDAGGIGWWSTRWLDEPVHETGWFVLPELQGRGIAAAAVALVVADVRAHGTHPLLTAFPSVENAASNALCARTGFALRGTDEAEFRGAMLRCNAWVLDLRTVGRADPPEAAGSAGPTAPRRPAGS